MGKRIGKYSILCQYANNSIRKIAHYLRKKYKLSKKKSIILALRIKLRSGAIVDYEKPNIERAWVIGAERIIDILHEYKIELSNIPVIQTNFPSLYQMYRKQKKLGGMKIEPKL